MDFWQLLPLKPRRKITRVLEFVQVNGPHVGEPLVRHLTGHKGLMELRVSFGSDAFRFFFFDAGNHELVLLHAIRKKTDKTPLREIETAEDRRAEFLRRQQWTSKP